MKKYYDSPELILEIMDDDAILNSGEETYDSGNIFEDDFTRDWL